MSGADETTQKRKKFRAILKRKKLTVMPGGFSPMYAKLAEEVGYEAFFLAGSQLSAFLYGLPDNGLIGLRDVVDHARHMVARTNIPILVDTDTGFGNAVNVHYTVQECIRAGVAGLQIEDQEAPKKSGTLSGRRCISIDEAVGKYRAAVAARDELDPTFVICARCDALGAEGENFKTTLARCIAYARDGGVDLIWLNSVETLDQLREACRKIPVPVLSIWAGHEAAPTHAEYEKMGLRIALYPTITSNAGIQAAWELLNELNAAGSEAVADWRKRVDKSPWGKIDRRKLLETGKIKEIEEKFLPKSNRRDYDNTWGHQTAFSGKVPSKRKPKAR